MKTAGLLLLLAGWFLVLSALAMLRAGAAQAAFVLAGMAVELVGLVMLLRAHIVLQGRRP